MNLSDSYHRPVMVDEVVTLLVTAADGAYVDATCGGGGHTMAIASRLTAGGRILALDRDPEAVAATRDRLQQITPQVRVVQGRFSDIRFCAAGAAITSVRGVLFDLGISSHQVDRPGRGFSYGADGPLDLRMDPGAPRCAADIIRTGSQVDLARLLFDYGGEKNSRRIASAIVKARAARDISTTRELAEVIAGVTNPRFLNKTLSRCFQALRIVVNDEMAELEKGLGAALDLLESGGRLVVIAYHSLEDRLVKQFLRINATATGAPAVPAPRLRLLTKRPLVPSPLEIAANPRARSAKLRAAEVS
jgi:16S rRNA (cytosine1402-N4)-methyltransferase